MSKQKRPCIFGCTRNACGNGDMCSTCKAGLRYWDDKDHADILRREEHLQVLSARMHFKASARTRKSRAVTRTSARHEARV